MHFPLFDDADWLPTFLRDFCTLIFLERLPRHSFQIISLIGPLQTQVEPFEINDSWRSGMYTLAARNVLGDVFRGIALRLFSCGWIGHAYVLYS